MRCTSFTKDNKLKQDYEGRIDCKFQEVEQQNMDSQPLHPFIWNWPLSHQNVSVPSSTANPSVMGITLSSQTSSAVMAIRRWVYT